MEKRPFTACLLFLLLTAAAAHAQIITIDKTDTAAYVKKALWNGNVSLGLEADKQKATLFDASNYLDISLQKSRQFFIFSGSERFTYNGSSSFLNKGYLHLRWRYNYKEQFHPESFVQYQWDDALGMVHRFVAGENIRYNFWHRKLWELSAATGIMYEAEIWNYTAVDSFKIPVPSVIKRSRELKSNNYLKLEADVSKVSKLAFIVFYQAALNDFFKPRVSGVINFSSIISKHFSLVMQYNGMFDAGPVVPVFKFYYSYSSTLLYKF